MHLSEHRPLLQRREVLYTAVYSRHYCSTDGLNMLPW